MLRNLLPLNALRVAVTAKLPFSKANVYVTLSFLIVASLAYQTAAEYHFQAFATSVALAHSRVFSFALANACIALFVFISKVFVFIFFQGFLHPQEKQRISERLLGMIFEYCLTLTFFHSSLNTAVTIVCLMSFAAKLLVQLCHARQMVIEQKIARPPREPSAVRLLALLSLMFGASVLALNYFIMRQSHLTEQPGEGNSGQRPLIYLMFACDALGVAVQSSALMLKVLFNEIEGFMGVMWDLKAKCRFYVEIICEVALAVVGVYFVVNVWMKISAPYFLGRSLFIHVRSVFKGISKFVHYNQLVRRIDIQLPSATVAEIAGLAEGDHDCSICYGPLDANAAVVKRLPCCRHYFHRQCLLRWLEGNTTCPYCRTEIRLNAPPPAAENNNNNQPAGAVRRGADVQPRLGIARIFIGADRRGAPEGGVAAERQAAQLNAELARVAENLQAQLQRRHDRAAAAAAAGGDVEAARRQLAEAVLLEHLDHLVDDDDEAAEAAVAAPQDQPNVHAAAADPLYELYKAMHEKQARRDERKRQKHLQRAANSARQEPPTPLGTTAVPAKSPVVVPPSAAGTRTPSGALPAATSPPTPTTPSEKPDAASAQVAGPAGGGVPLARGSVLLRKLATAEPPAAQPSTTPVVASSPAAAVAAAAPEARDDAGGRPPPVEVERRLDALEQFVRDMRVAMERLEANLRPAA